MMRCSLARAISLSIASQNPWSPISPHRSAAMHRATHAGQQSLFSMHATSAGSSSSGSRQHGHSPSMSLLAIRATGDSCLIKQEGARKLCEGNNGIKKRCCVSSLPQDDSFLVSFHAEPEHASHSLSIVRQRSKCLVIPCQPLL